jgi:hypothetical protein
MKILDATFLIDYIERRSDEAVLQRKQAECLGT